MSSDIHFPAMKCVQKSTHKKKQFYFTKKGTSCDILCIFHSPLRFDLLK